MAGRGSGPDFVEALARGLDVLRCVRRAPPRRCRSAEVAVATGLARPTARRLLLTLEELGYVRSSDGAFALTPEGDHARHGVRRVPRSLGRRPAPPRGAGRQTGESSSMAQLDGGDIVYVARVSVPKIIALRVDIGTLFPAPADLAGQGAARRARPRTWARASLADPSRSGLPPTPATAARGPATRSSPRSAPGAGPSPTRSSPPACAPLPSPSATAPAPCAPP